MMKKRILPLFTAGFLMVGCGQSNPEAGDETTGQDSLQEQDKKAEKVEPKLTLAWETDTILTTNESVLYNPADGKLYVSNIAGQPTDKDDVGFISILNTDGSVADMKWVTGLDAPKGMAIKEDMLYVTNVDELLEIKMPKGEITTRWDVDDAEFLNDVAIGNNAVYFSDMNTGKLHKMQDGKVKTVFEGLEGLNGLAFHNGTLYMLSKRGMLSMGSDEKVQSMNDLVTGGDGLVVIDDDTFLASRWQGEIWLIDEGKATKLLDSSADEIQTADIGFIPEQNLVLVPRFFSNKVSAYKLEY